MALIGLKTGHREMESENVKKAYETMDGIAFATVKPEAATKKIQSFSMFLLKSASMPPEVLVNNLESVSS